MYTSRRISPCFPQLIFIKQRRIRNRTEEKNFQKPNQKKQRTKKQTKNSPKSPNLKFSSESQMPKEN